MIRATARSSAPVARLWQVASDVERWAEHLATFESVTALQPGPMRVGSRYRVKQPGLLTADYQVSELREGQAFTWVGRVPGVLVTASHEVYAEGDGSRIELILTWTGPAAPFVRRAMNDKGQRMVTLEAETFARVAASG